MPAFALSACGGEDGGASASKASVIATPTYSLSGRVTFDRVPARNAAYGGGIRLDYSAIASRPARRVTVQAISTASGEAVASSVTDDSGDYVLRVPEGRSVRVRAVAALEAAAYRPDGIGTENCSGGGWNVSVVDNASDDAQYVLETGEIHGAAATSVNLHAPLAFAGSGAGFRYTNRAAAPFSVLDLALDEMEAVCAAKPSASFPKLVIHWSPDNTNVSGDLARGEIGGSFQRGVDGYSEIYLLGKENVDTDEYDPSVVLHEMGHYIDEKLYRQDTLGGRHLVTDAYGDALDPATAWCEGFATFMANMTTGDPAYADTYGAAQASGWQVSSGTAPLSDNRSVFNEKSVSYLLWKLYSNRGSFDRIHRALGDYASKSVARVSSHLFAAYYNQLFGKTADGLFAVWDTQLNSAYDSLCSGACAGAGDTADVWDADNDLGQRYAASSYRFRVTGYHDGAGPVMSAEFWRLYRTVTAGTVTPTDHDQLSSGGHAEEDYPYNKTGMVRWYRLTGTGRQASIAVSAPTGPLGLGMGCATDHMDLYVWANMTYKSFSLWAWDTDSTGVKAGCPSVSWPTVPGRDYVFTLLGKSDDVRSYTLTIGVTP